MPTLRKPDSAVDEAGRIRIAKPMDANPTEALQIVHHQVAGLTEGMDLAQRRELALEKLQAGIQGVAHPDLSCAQLRLCFRAHVSPFVLILSLARIHQDSICLC